MATIRAPRPASAAPRCASAGLTGIAFDETSSPDGTRIALRLPLAGRDPG